jgi:hypothetical protein
MMGGKKPKTCWAVNKRQDSKLENFCIWLEIYLNYTMMHGLTNLKKQHKYLSKFNFFLSSYLNINCYNSQPICLFSHFLKPLSLFQQFHKRQNNFSGLQILPLSGFVTPLNDFFKAISVF